MNNTPKVLTERIDDFVLLIELLKQMGVVELFDNHLPIHGHHQGLGWGWMGTIWLAHIFLKVITESLLSVIGSGRHIILWKKSPGYTSVKQILPMID